MVTSRRRIRVENYRINLKRKMKKMLLNLMFIAILLINMSCKDDLVVYEENDIKITVEKGEEYLHDFELFWGINKKSTPQMAIWIEDTAGNYISTIYVTHTIATQSWTASGGERRKSALPTWCHSRGIKYPDGLYLPTKKEPVADGISGATPKGSYDVKIKPVGNLQKFILKMEVNHSTDWNDSYPKNAKEGDSNWSGGKEGSGQPALVYATEVDLESRQRQSTAILIGHSSPDGSDGEIYPDISQLTTALKIIKQITVNIQ